MSSFTALPLLLIGLFFVGVSCQNTDQDTIDKLKTDLYILAGVLGGVCLILLIGLAFVCVTFSRLKKSVSKHGSAPKMTEDPMTRYNPGPIPPPRPESRPLGYHAGGDSGSAYGYAPNLGRPTRYEGPESRAPPGGNLRNVPASSPYGAPVVGGRSNPAYMDEATSRGRGGGYGY